MYFSLIAYLWYIIATSLTIVTSTSIPFHQYLFHSSPSLQSPPTTQSTFLNLPYPQTYFPSINHHFISFHYFILIFLSFIISTYHLILIVSFSFKLVSYKIIMNKINCVICNVVMNNMKLNIVDSGILIVCGRLCILSKGVMECW